MCLGTENLATSQLKVKGLEDLILQNPLFEVSLELVKERKYKEYLILNLTVKFKSQVSPEVVDCGGSSDEKLIKGPEKIIDHTGPSVVTGKGTMMTLF